MSYVTPFLNDNAYKVIQWSNEELEKTRIFICDEKKTSKQCLKDRLYLARLVGKLFIELICDSFMLISFTIASPFLRTPIILCSKNQKLKNFSEKTHCLKAVMLWRLVCRIFSISIGILGILFIGLCAPKKALLMQEKLQILNKQIIIKKDEAALIFEETKMLSKEEVSPISSSTPEIDKPILEEKEIVLDEIKNQQEMEEASVESLPSSPLPEIEKNIIESENFEKDFYSKLEEKNREDTNRLPEIKIINLESEMPVLDEKLHKTSSGELDNFFLGSPFLIVKNNNNLHQI